MAMTTSCVFRSKFDLTTKSGQRYCNRRTGWERDVDSNSGLKMTRISISGKPSLMAGLVSRTDRFGTLVQGGQNELSGSGPYLLIGMYR